MTTVTQALKQKHGIDAKPGTKIKCPKCGHKTFNIDGQDTIGKCFHPTCGYAITNGSSSQFGARAIIVQMMNHLGDVGHRALLRSAKSATGTVYKYVTEEREIHRSVVVHSRRLGIVSRKHELAAQYRSSVELFEAGIQELAPKEKTAKTKDSEKTAAKVSKIEAELEDLADWYTALCRLVDARAGWILFAYEDSNGNVCSLRVRNPGTKDFRSFKPFPHAGLFMPAVCPPPKKASTASSSPLIVTEGEFNSLQLLSLYRRSHTGTVKPSDIPRVVSVGGVTIADHDAIAVLSDEPLIVYDNDSAGRALVEKALDYVNVRAATTPEADTDLDDYIRAFGKQYSQAWAAFGRLIEDSEELEKSHKQAAGRVFGMRLDRDQEGKSLNNPPFVIKQKVAEVILGDLQTRGHFLNDRQRGFFFNRFNRELVPVDGESLQFILLADRYGLNPTETIYNYVVEALAIEAHDNGVTTDVRRLAHYEAETQSLYLFNHGNEIYRITADAIDLVPNGTDGVLFARERDGEEFHLAEVEPERSPFVEVVLSKFNFSSWELHRDEQRLLAMFWIQSMFFSSIMHTRPILALIGEKGSGKTSVLRALGQVLIGPKFDVTPLTSDERDFDAAASNSHLMVLDNADAGIKWLNDRLAVAATGSTIQKRRLYTTNTVEYIALRPYLAITARSPKFRRDDVAERLIVLRLSRIEGYRSENTLRDEVVKQRDAAMTELMHHLQDIIRALAAHKDPIDLGDFRMADFGEFCLKIARYFGHDKAVRGVLARLSRAQMHFTLEDDSVLELLKVYAEENPNKEVTSVVLHGELCAVAEELNTTFVYDKNPRGFAQRLANITSELQEFLDVRVSDLGGRRRTYRFGPRGEK